jgi:predicted chitinase
MFTTQTRNNANFVISELKNSGITNKLIQDAIVLVAFKESKFLPQVEKCYNNTSNVNIRKFFSRMRNQSDDFINDLKKDCKKFFDYVYNGIAGNGPEDGYKYRGRGFHQITGESNYRYYGNLTGYDILKEPDLVLQPKIASAVLSQYYLSTPKNWLKKNYGYNDLNAVNNWMDAKKIIYHVTAGIGKSKTSLFENDATGGWKYINQFEKKILGDLSGTNQIITNLVIATGFFFLLRKPLMTWIKKNF